MKKHPSLTAPRLPSSRVSLQPVRKMGRNEKCWCKSGVKYKHCHAIREAQEPANIFGFEQKLHEELREGYCSLSHKGDCSSTITKAHTIQRRGGLAAISEDNHVLTVKPKMIDMIESKGRPRPRKIGIKKASVFPGFCSRHDSEVFKPIEGSHLEISQETAFLFSYRAISYERFAKEAEARHCAFTRDTADRGKSFEYQTAIQDYLYAYSLGVEAGKREISEIKKQFDDRLASSSYCDFHYAAITFNGLLPIVACAAFFPEFDLKGTPLQRLGQLTTPLESLSLTLTSFEGKSVAVFGWIGEKDGPSSALIASLIELDDTKLAGALIRLIFIHSDNVFCKQSWWEELTASQQDELVDLTQTGTPTTARHSENYTRPSTHLSDILRDKIYKP